MAAVGTNERDNAAHWKVMKNRGTRDQGKPKESRDTKYHDARQRITNVKTSDAQGTAVGKNAE